MSRTKWKITLQNIRLIDLPTRQNRMFLKIKNCVSNVITKSYQIVNNQCNFTDSVVIEVYLPTNLLKAVNKNSRSLKIKPLRFSFRLENSSRSGFQRYGIVMIDLLKLIMENTQPNNSYNTRSYRTGLENCSEKPVFSVNFIFPQGYIPKNVILNPSNIQINNNDISTSPNSNSTSKSNATNNSSSQYSSPKCSQSSQNNNYSKNQNTTEIIAFPVLEKSSVSTSISNSNQNNVPNFLQSNPLPNNNISSITIPTMSNSNPTYYGQNISISSGNSNRLDYKKSLENLPINMTKQRYDELEGEIDNLLAGIINDESIQ